MSLEILCKTRTTANDVQQIKWAPRYKMGAEDGHEATKIQMKVRVDPSGDDKKGTWTAGKKVSVPYGEYFSKYRKIWTPWVGAKREREIRLKLVWHRSSPLSDYVVGQSPVSLPTADSGDCGAV